MEGSIVVKYDYYVGRRVTKVSRLKKGWYIELEGGVRITNHDESIPAPDIPVGHLFTSVNEDNDLLTFGDGLAPGRQTFRGAKFNIREGTIYLPEVDKHLTPQFEEPDIGTPPDPSADRVVDGLPDLEPLVEDDNGDEE